MPKRTKQTKRRTTDARASDGLVNKAILNKSIIKLPSRAQISLLMAKLGKKGGKKGGKRRLETMTSIERSEIARKAAQARWNGR